MLKALNQILDLIYENSCLICSGPCEKLLVCSLCEKSFIERKQNFTKHFDEITVFSWGLYEGKLREGIIKLKNGKKKLANYFGDKLTHFWQKLLLEISNKQYILLPVPSHKKRIKERGYCQSTLITKEFLKYFQYEYLENFLVRTKETYYMNSLSSLKERIENIKDAFEIRGSTLPNKDFLIIDDILTSGSTMCEIAKTIHKQFPDTNIYGLTIAAGDKYN